jgi:DNA-binding MarR family transcriptional regulator
MMAQFSFAEFQRGRHMGVLKELGLTPGHMKVLSVLEPGAPRPMGVIAESCACDPSMATFLVDRLEERGLVERRMLPSDRRVKTVALTPLGVKTKGALLDRLFQPPDELVALDRSTLEALHRALGKLPHRSNAFFTSGPTSEPLARPSRPARSLREPAAG